MPIITITIAPYSPVRTTIGRGRPYDQFDAFVDGVWLCRSRIPLLDGARALLKLGHDPATVIVMRHEGSDTISLRSTISHSAVLTVREKSQRGTYYGRWRQMRWGAPPLCTQEASQ